MTSEAENGKLEEKFRPSFTNLKLRSWSVANYNSCSADLKRTFKQHYVAIEDAKRYDEAKDIEFIGKFLKREQNKVEKHLKQLLNANKRIKREKLKGKTKKRGKRKSNIEIEYHVQDGSTREDELRQKYRSLTISDLKSYLGLNKHVTGEKKAELVER